MLIAVVIGFVICWTPLHIWNLAITYFPDAILRFESDEQLTQIVAMQIAFHMLAVAHSFINPIVYSFMSMSFRVSTTEMCIHATFNTYFDLLLLFLRKNCVVFSVAATRSHHLSNHTIIIIIIATSLLVRQCIMFKNCLKRAIANITNKVTTSGENLNGKFKACAG